MEVLEHVRNPDKVLAEACRMLVPGGLGIITMPFLYGVHADPCDFQRWTADKLHDELKRAGFTDIQILPMGGPFSVVFDVFWTVAWRANRLFVRRLSSVLLMLLKPLALMADRWVPEMAPYLTGGVGGNGTQGSGFSFDKTGMNNCRNAVSFIPTDRR